MKVTKEKNSKKLQWKLSRIYSWYFLLDLLKMEDTRDLLVWTDFSKLEFKIKDGLFIARLWSQVNGRKQNVTYESFKRTLRHYYGKGIIEKIPKKPHCYQFVKSPKTMFILEDLYNMSHDQKMISCDRSEDCQVPKPIVNENVISNNSKNVFGNNNAIFGSNNTLYREDSWFPMFNTSWRDDIENVDLETEKDSNLFLS